MKRTIKKIFALITLTTFAFQLTPVMAVEGTSSWAEEEVTLALEEGIVPDKLASGYTTEIKRYEYVLLALEIYELKGKEVTIKTKYPFTDIYDHTYEDEIVKAYNAGIIKGNGNGTFRPDDPINRQEIASLVVNLIKGLDNVEILETAGSYNYSDSTNISTWAIDYINYCYENNIMNGVGKDAEGRTQIAPLEEATREQAILLLYRLGLTKELYGNDELGTITVYEYPDIDSSSGTKVAVQSDVINDFAVVFGQELAEKLVELSKLDNVEITNLSRNYVSIFFINEGKIIISNDGFTTDMTLELLSLDDSTIVAEFGELVGTMTDAEAVTDAIARDINVFADDQSYTMELVLSDKEIYQSEAELIGDDYRYIFEYQLSGN